MQEILLKERYFQRGLSKSLKKGNFIFSIEKTIKNKKDLELVNRCYSGYETSSKKLLY